MRICILANENHRTEFLQKKTNPGVELIWVSNINELIQCEADVYIDLLFENIAERIQVLKALLPATILINSVVHTSRETDPSFIRINAWPGFIGRNICEIAVSQDDLKEKAMHLLNYLGWSYKFVPDLPGMIAPRVIAMIVNEAYFALGENVSTRNEIDTAMKLGTNYPFGPFEWSKKIGLNNIYELLDKMSLTDERYTVAGILKTEATA